MISTLALLVSLTLFAALWIRNDQVHRYRSDLLRQVSEAAQSDIRRGRAWQWEWRYHALNDESYFRMAWSIWRPLDSFYPDRSFIDPEATGPREQVTR